jgi:hypothetical protein
VSRGPRFYFCVILDGAQNTEVFRDSPGLDDDDLGSLWEQGISQVAQAG